MSFNSLNRNRKRSESQPKIASLNDYKINCINFTARNKKPIQKSRTSVILSQLRCRKTKPSQATKKEAKSSRKLSGVGAQVTCKHFFSRVLMMMIA